jgi:hypothetical protein
MRMSCYRIRYTSFVLGTVHRRTKKYSYSLLTELTLLVCKTRCQQLSGHDRGIENTQLGSVRLSRLHREVSQITVTVLSLEDGGVGAARIRILIVPYECSTMDVLVSSLPTALFRELASLGFSSMRTPRGRLLGSYMWGPQQSNRRLACVRSCLKKTELIVLQL